MKIADGVYVHFIPTQKYKTNRIVFRMTGSLNTVSQGSIQAHFRR